MRDERDRGMKDFHFVHFFYSYLVFSGLMKDLSQYFLSRRGNYSIYVLSSYFQALPISLSEKIIFFLAIGKSSNAFEKCLNQTVYDMAARRPRRIGTSARRQQLYFSELIIN
jgi:hypothetical protein